MNTSSAAFVLLLLIASGWSCTREKPDPAGSEFSSEARVDSLVEEVLEPEGPGCVVAIFKDGRVAFERGYGKANLDYGIPVTPATVFDVASISKQFTAAGIMILAERGRLSLDDDIRKYIPEFPDYGHRIEIKRLLNHTSGIRDWVWLLTLGGVPFENFITRQELFDLICGQSSLAFEPGANFSYSNSAYNLLSLIVERVSGMPFSRFVDSEIFQPLGMKNSCVFDDRRMVIENRALGYIPDDENGWLMEHYFNPVFTGSSNIHTTVDDLFLWDNNFYSGKVGPAGMPAEMEAQGALNNGETIGYGLGLWVGEYRGLRTAGHDGDWAGSYHYMLRFPDQRLTLVCLSNTHTFSPRWMCYKLADLCLAEWYEMELPEQEPDAGTTQAEAQTIDPRVYDLLAGEYVNEYGRKIWLRRDNDMLFVRFPGSRALRVLPRSETEFFQEAGKAELSVVRKDSGEIEYLEWQDAGRTTIYRRSPYDFSNFDISGNASEYIGSYYSADLRATYRITSTEHGLVLETPINSRYMMELTGINAATPLVALARDNFRFAFFNLEFSRDINGRIVGYSLIHPWASLKIEFTKRP